MDILICHCFPSASVHKQFSEPIGLATGCSSALFIKTLYMGQSLRRFHAVHIPVFPRKSIKKKVYKKGNKLFVSDLDLEELQKDVMNHRPKCVEELERITKFSKREIKIMYRGFKQECPNGYLDETKFIEIYKPFFPQGNVEPYATHIYRTMFKGFEGPITFDRLLLTLSMLCFGTDVEKIEWTFDLYDINRNGFISKKDFTDVVFSVYQLLGERAYPPVTRGAIVEHANEIFEKIDTANDNEISMDEFKAAYLNDGTFLKNIQSLATRL